MCGKELLPDQKFCTECGEPVEPVIMPTGTPPAEQLPPVIPPVFPPVSEPPKKQQPKNIFQLYQDAFGYLATRTISEELLQLEKEYSHDWLVDAMKETSLNNAKSLKYTAQILSRWKTQGKNTNGKKANQPNVTYQRVGDD